MMGKRDSKLLVVDACVMRAAGLSDHPVSSACGRALKEILMICHRVVLTSDIKLEWRKHGGKFALQWLSAMHSRKKIKYYQESDVVATWSPPKALQRLSPAERARVEKDAHLISAACTGDGIIVTNETHLVQVFQKHPDILKTPKPVRWIVPVQMTNELEKL